MPELLPFLKQLIAAPGLSAYEEPVRKILFEAWAPLTDEVNTSKLGSIHALKRGQAGEPRPSLLLAAHMDAIGLMVKGQQSGFLRITHIGGIDPRVLPGQPVTVHGRQDLPAIIVQPPASLLPPDLSDKTVPVEYLWVDTGLPASQVNNLVRVGDPISFAQPPLETAEGTLTGARLDNRASVAALTSCLEMLQGRPHKWDVWAVATTQEEVNFGGAFTSAHQIRPDVAVIIDTTFGESPESPRHRTFPLGKGPTLGWGPNVHPTLFETFRDLADRLEIPYHVEVMPRYSATDADAIQITAEGIPSMVIMIPLRYMHTPVEMVALKDVERAGRLVAEFAAQLEIDFMEKLAWNET